MVPARTYHSQKLKRSVRAGNAALMYTVYVLKDKNSRLYKGVTNNLERRLREHRSGQTVTTAKMSEFEVVYTELFETFQEARAREKYFKTSAGRRFLKSKV